MVYKVFADTNVFLDHLLRRTADWHFSEKIFRLADERMIKVCTSSSSMVNVIYVLKQQRLTKADIIQATTYILSYIKLADTGEKIFIEALNSSFMDLEDAVQYFTALNIQDADYFITSNTKDFKVVNDRLPVLTPKQFISLFEKK